MSKLKILELFGGIGACSKALENLGIDYEIADYVEIDKYAVKSFNAIHNTNFEPQDITQWNKDIEVDLIMHGSPCQDFSIAGKQAGGDKDSGTRSSLMYETIRIVNKLKPKYVIWENVKNLLSKKHRHNFDAYLETMEQLGYKNFYQVLNAKDYGIPQNRERVFTVSIRNDIDKDYIFPPKQELELKLKDMLEDEVDEKYYLSESKIQKIANWKAYQKPFEKVQGKNSIVPTLTARGAGEEHSGMITYCDDLYETTDLQEECLNIKNTENYIEWYEKGKLDVDCRAYKEDKISGTIMTTPKNKILLKEELCNQLIKNGKVKEFDVIRHSYSNSRMKDWENRNIEKHNEVPTLDTRCDCLGVTVKTIGNYSPSNHNASRVVDNDGLAPTVMENHGTVTATNVSNLRIRKLTPKECWRLMGFDDKDFEKAAKVNSNAQLYKQAGNSIVVNVLMAILEILLREI